MLMFIAYHVDEPQTPSNCKFWKRHWYGVQDDYSIVYLHQAVMEMMISSCKKRGSELHLISHSAIIIMKQKVCIYIYITIKEAMQVVTLT